MPYSTSSKKAMSEVRKRLEKTYQNVTDKMCRTFAHAFNSVYDKTKDDGRSMAAGYAAVNRTGAKKKKRKASVLGGAVLRVAIGTIKATMQIGNRRIFVELRSCPKPPSAPALDYQRQRAYCRHDGRDCPLLQMVLPDGASIVCKAADSKTRTDK